MNLWLIPASNEASQRNIPKTLSAPISNERKIKVDIKDKTFAWGAKASSDKNVNLFNKMATEDYCLFYTQSPSGGDKKYHWHAQISEKIKSTQVSEVLWDVPDFELVYFLKNVKKVEITTEQLSTELAEFRLNYFKEAPKGFTSVDEKVVAGIIDKYGDVGRWLSKFQTNIRFWVEKTIVEGRPDRKEGPHALGKALWSPQRAEDNRDIYRLMREVREGDVVFHFVDNKELRGVSIAASQADETFSGVEGTEWSGRASYRVPLREYRSLAPAIHRADFLADNNYRSRISNMLEEHRGLFFNREFNLNQGSYLTKAPIELVQVWDEIYRQKTGHALLPEIDLGIVPPVISFPDPAIHQPLDAKSVDAFEQALREADVVVSRTLVIRMLSSLVSKNLLLLTGLAGSGKTKLAQSLARWLPSSSNCFRVVAVGADWIGNENVLGYPNGLEKTSYISKPSLDVILHAKANQAIPHFLILDEMNLSHVERYFADILSAIESDEKIHLHQDLERKANGTIIPADVELSKNLFIIGTVNVDETTYMFSPKVLDRANVIEFRMDAAELEGFLDNPAKPDLSKLDGKGASFGKAFVDAAKNPVAVPPEVKATYDAEMLLLFKTLQAHGAEFGYRTAYETARFINFYKLLGNHADGDITWFPGAFDCVIFQKLLPKLHGSRAKLGPVLKKLWFLCVNDAAGRGVDALKAGEEAARSTDKKAEPSLVVPAGAPYPLSAEKIGRMWRLLIDNGFASFAEA